MSKGYKNSQYDPWGKSSFSLSSKAEQNQEKWEKLDNYVKEQTPEEICRVFWEFSYECDGGAMQQMEIDKLNIKVKGLQLSYEVLEQENKQLKDSNKVLKDEIELLIEQVNHYKQKLEKIKTMQENWTRYSVHEEWETINNKMREILEKK